EGRGRALVVHPSGVPREVEFTGPPARFRGFELPHVALALVLSEIRAFGNDPRSILIRPLGTPSGRGRAPTERLLVLWSVSRIPLWSRRSCVRTQCSMPLLVQTYPVS